MSKRPWLDKPQNPAMRPAVVEAIARRRRQLLVHSYIYYVLNDNIITDDLWQKWADQLVKLHAKFGKRIGFYDRAFADWTAATGTHLPFDVGVQNAAEKLIAYRDAYAAKHAQARRRKAPASTPAATWN